MGNMGSNCKLHEKDSGIVQKTEFINIHESALENHEKIEDIYLEMARNLFGESKYEEALKIYRKAFNSYTRKGRAHFENSEFEESLRYYEKAMETYNEISAKLKDEYINEEVYEQFKLALSIYSEMGERLLSMENYQKALNSYEEFKHVREFDSLLENGKYKSAAECYRKRLDHHKEKGNEYLNADKCDKALEHYTRAIDVYGMGKEDLEKIPKAERDEESHQKIKSIMAKIWHKKGKILQARSELKEALDAYEQAITIDTENAEAQLGKGEVLSSLGRHQDALNAYRELEKNSSGSSFEKAKLLYELGNTLSYLGDEKEALNSYKEAHEKFYEQYKGLKNEKDSKKEKNEEKRKYKDKERKRITEYFYNSLFKAEMWKNVQNESLEKGEGGSNLDCVKFYHEKGNTFHIFGNYQKALEAYQEAFKIYKKDGTEHEFGYIGLICGKGDVFAKLRNYEEALKSYRKAVQYCEQKWKGRSELDIKNRIKAAKMLVQSLRKKIDIFKKLRDFNRAKVHEKEFRTKELVHKSNGSVKTLWKAYKTSKDKKAAFKRAEEFEKEISGVSKNALKKIEEIEDEISTIQRNEELDLDPIVENELDFEIARLYETMDDKKAEDKKAKEIYRRIVDFFAESTDKVDAEKLRDEVLQHFGSSEDRKNRINEMQSKSAQLYQAGRVFYALRRYEEARKALEKAAVLNLSHIDTLITRAKALHKLELYSEELRISFDAIKMDPENFEAWKVNGNALYRLEKYEEALKSYERSIELNPGYLDGYHNKGLILYYLGKYEKAERAFGRAMSITPHDRMTLCGRGYTLIKLKKFKEALCCLEQALSEDSDYPLALYYKGIALHNLKRFEEALDVFEHAIESHQEDDLELLKAKGKTLEKLGLFHLAKKTFEKAVQVDRKNAGPYIWLAEVYFANGDISHAFEHAEKALSLDPANGDALLLKGIIKIKQKEYCEAIEYIEKANSTRLDDASFFLWGAYTKYIKLESLICKEVREKQSTETSSSEKKKKKLLKYETHMREIFEITSDLEKASKLAKKLKNYEQRACILYFLAYFYYKCNDLFTAKEKLCDCIKIRRAKVRPRAKELLGIIWNRHIQSPWWNWWLSSPLHTTKKRIFFFIISFLIVVFAFHALFPDVIPSVIESNFEDNGSSQVDGRPFGEEGFNTKQEGPTEKEKDTRGTIQEGESGTNSIDENVSRISYAAVIVFLILILLLPNIQNIKAQDIDIELCSPPSIDLFLSPSTMEAELEELNGIGKVEL